MQSIPLTGTETELKVFENPEFGDAIHTPHGD